jgi:arsenate reductase
MAEGFARALRSDLDAYSAGIAPHGVNPIAVRVMREAGVDISRQRSKSVEDVQDVSFDYIVTVCEDAREACPLWHGPGKVIHFGFDDPPRLAAHAHNEQEALNHYRRVRDEIRQFIETIEEHLEAPAEAARA